MTILDKAGFERLTSLVREIEEAVVPDDIKSKFEELKDINPNVDGNVFMLHECVCRQRLWERIGSLEVRLCDDHGKVVEVDLTDWQFRRQDWGGLRVGLCDDLRIWIGKHENAKVAESLTNSETPPKRTSRPKQSKWILENFAAMRADGQGHDQIIRAAFEQVSQDPTNTESVFADSTYFKFIKESGLEK